MSVLINGDKVRKVGGTYEAEGTIAGTVITSRGDVRYVFEFDAFPGMLHIFNESQLKRIDAPKERVVRGAIPE